MENHLDNFLCDTLSQTLEVAKYFSRYAKKGCCFALYGDLGIGKTTFSKFLIQSLNPKIENVTSPTFNIVQIYECPITEIWHVDCYRLKSESEIVELGLEEAFASCITIIEWPEIVENFLPSDTIRLCFSLKNGSRIIESKI